MPAADILHRIVAARRERFGLSPDGSASTPLTGAFAFSGVGESNPFVGALRARRGRAVIAEVKMGSPRLGNLAGRFDPAEQAAIYGRGGAAALSVVVEPDFFFGSCDLLRRCKAASGLPAIAKDFLVDERQLDDAAAAGADAFLLIAALHTAEELSGWAAAVRERGMAPLAETHDEEDLDRVAAAVAAGAGPWEMVGINNRDLRTFDVSLDASIALRGRIPAGALAVAESGIAARADLDKLSRAGFDAFLVGESLLLAPDPAEKLAELVS